MKRAGLFLGPEGVAIVAECMPGTFACPAVAADELDGRTATALAAEILEYLVARFGEFKVAWCNDPRANIEPPDVDGAELVRTEWATIAMMAVREGIGVQKERIIAAPVVATTLACERHGAMTRSAVALLCYAILHGGSEN